MSLENFQILLQYEFATCIDHLHPCPVFSGYWVWVVYTLYPHPSHLIAVCVILNNHTQILVLIGRHTHTLNTMTPNLYGFGIRMYGIDVLMCIAYYDIPLLNWDSEEYF